MPVADSRGNKFYGEDNVAVMFLAGRRRPEHHRHDEAIVDYQ
jgi:hypothetical protein